jgi:pimeloyl-ACP methyl ester carboxylesterase
MCGAEMQTLASRLRGAGYATRVLWYSPWSVSLDGAAAKLWRVVSSLEEDVPPHYVGHSLGGHVILRMLAEHPPLSACRVVTLATAHGGSAAARRAARIPPLRPTLGPALREVCGAKPIPVCRNCELGTMAGTLSLFFLGRILGLDRPNDSVVAVSEAHHPGASDRLTLRESHSTLLVSRKAAKAVIRFLAEGTFGARNEPNGRGQVALNLTRHSRNQGVCGG